VPSLDWTRGGKQIVLGRYAALKGIDPPTLVVLGERDFFLGVPHMQRRIATCLLGHRSRLWRD
jgi:hypothetical protein